LFFYIAVNNNGKKYTLQLFATFSGAVLQLFATFSGAKLQLFAR